MNLNPKQFGAVHGEQLPMFMETERVIDEMHKGDYMGPLNASTFPTPREQWEYPPRSGWYSLRDEKRDELDDIQRHGSSRRSHFSRQRANQALEPIEVVNSSLYEGHHRLAYAEDEGMPYLPVKWLSHG
jgi:hypothetical protein